MTKHPVLESVTKIDLPAADKLTPPTVFTVDTEAEMRASITLELRAQAGEMDAEAASDRLRRNHIMADRLADRARAFRMVADHLSSSGSVP